MTPEVQIIKNPDNKTVRVFVKSPTEENCFILLGELDIKKFLDDECLVSVNFHVN